MRRARACTVHLQTVFAIAVAAVFAVVVPVSAAPILSGGANIAPSPIYSTGPSIWNMPAGTNITSSTMVAPASVFPNLVWSYTGTISWSGNPLTFDDLSVPNLAHGYFGAGGTLQIDGQVSDMSGAMLYTGTLLTASVGSFEVQETGVSSDNLDIVGSPVITVTGGWLATGGGANEMGLGWQYSLTTSGVDVSNFSGSVDDFSETIFSTAGTIMQLGFVDVPEPGSLVLLLAGGACLLRKRSA